MGKNRALRNCEIITWKLVLRGLFQIALFLSMWNRHKHFKTDTYKVSFDHKKERVLKVTHRNAFCDNTPIAALIFLRLVYRAIIPLTYFDLYYRKLKKNCQTYCNTLTF